MSIDPSLRNTGVSLGEITLDGEVLVEKVILSTTEKESKKNIRVSTDTINRSRSLYNFLQETIREFEPKVVFVETPSGSQNASSMKSYGIVCALIATINPPPIEVSPIEVKMAFIGDKKASKQQIINKAVELYPDAGWLKIKDRILNKNEHCADAVAVAIAGVQTVQFKQLINYIK